MLFRSPPQVHTFSVRGERLPQRFSLGPECEGDGVEEAVVFRDGLLVLTPARHLWWVVGPCRVPLPAPHAPRWGGALLAMWRIVCCCGPRGKHS